MKEIRYVANEMVVRMKISRMRKTQNNEKKHCNGSDSNVMGK